MSALACRGCGVATGHERVSWVHPTTLTGLPRPSFEVGVCDDCVSLRLDENGSAVRAALRVIHKPEKDWSLAAEAFAEAGIDVTPTLYERAKPQRKPFGHVPREVSDALKAAYVQVLDRKVHAATDKDRPMPPAGPPEDTTWRGCLFCGLDKQAEPWRGPVTTTALKKPEMVSGYLCTPCGDAVEAAGAVGAPALERAVMAAHGYEWTDNVTIPGLRAWVATEMAPLSTPWLWVDLREPVAAIDPLALMHKRIEDLTAKVEALERRLS